MRRRLDTELVERGLASNRTDAQRAIDEGRVRVHGVAQPKPATLVSTAQRVTVHATEHRWASRGGDKLSAAIGAFGLDVSGKKALDVGASTGGFTDVLLHHGASRVVALDVGYGQLAWRLRHDRRVDVRERVNFRLVDPVAIGAPFDTITVDVSFIGAALLAPKIVACGASGTDTVILVKPQFEVGRRRVGRGGIVTDPEAHVDAVAGVARALADAGVGSVAAIPSPILGAKGNREFLLHAIHGHPGGDPAVIAGEAVA